MQRCHLSKLGLACVFASGFFLAAAVQAHHWEWLGIALGCALVARTDGIHSHSRATSRQKAPHEFWWKAISNDKADS